MAAKTITREKPIPEKKTKAVDELADLAKVKKTILIASTKNLPDRQFQEIRKKLRGEAIIKVPKKSVIFRAIDKVEQSSIKKLKEQIGSGVALMFSDLDTFELASELIKNKVPAKAKIGQISNNDIEILAGPTDLVPGPAISELGSLGIQIQIEEGKITIKQPKVIVKKGQKISENAAGIMNKLDIKPFSVGFEPIAAFDTKEEKIYTELKIGREEFMKELKIAHSKAMAFAVSICYASKDTIKFLIGKAGNQGKALEKLINIENDNSKNKVNENADKENGEVKSDNVEKVSQEKNEENTQPEENKSKQEENKQGEKKETK